MTRRLLRIFSPFLLLLCSAPFGAQVRLNLYAGPFTFNVSSSGVGALESAVAAGGDAIVVNRSGTLTTAYTVRDHLGSTRAVVGRDGTVLECDEYYPFGQRHDLGRNYPVLASNRLKYNGKEQQDFASLSLLYLDYGARLYNPAILRWNAQDPLQEKYYHICHYSFSLNNPVSNVDVDGRVVFIKGSNQQDALDLLQAAVGEKLTLSINEKGRLSYEMAKEGRLGSKAKLMAKIIDDSEIYVNLETKSDNHNSLGGILVGGAFMGNELLNDNSIVRTHQEISTETLYKADVKDNHNIGKNILHELSESYFGGLISKSKKTAAPPAESDENNPIFERAHRRATPQSKIIKAVNKSDSDNSIVSEQYYVNEIEPGQLILNHSY